MSDQTLSERIDAWADVLGKAGYGSDALRLEAAAHEVAALQAELIQAKAELDGFRAWKRSVDKALNSGDGAYRP